MYRNYTNHDVGNNEVALAVRLAAMNTSIPSPDAEDSDVSDEALLIAVGNSQNVDAFNQLFKRFARKIFALGMKLTRNEQLANDLIQESMLNVWQKAPLYDLDKGSAKGWIFTLESGAEPTMVHEDIGGQQVELSLIEGYFDQLSDPQRAVVEQIYIKDRTHEEAAAHLQIPLGTLKSRLRLGVTKLRNLIGVNE